MIHQKLHLYSYPIIHTIRLANHTPGVIMYKYVLISLVIRIYLDLCELSFDVY